MQYKISNANFILLNGKYNKMQNKTHRKCGQFSINSHTYTWREIVILFTACFQKAKSINDNYYKSIEIIKYRCKCRVNNKNRKIKFRSR